MSGLVWACPSSASTAERRFAVQHHYAVPDDAWCVELSEAVPAPAEWAGLPDARTHLPGAAFLAAVIPDEDPELEPTVRVHGRDVVVPYEIMRWLGGHHDPGRRARADQHVGGRTDGR